MEINLSSDPIILKHRLPRGIAIRPTSYGVGLFATAPFRKGEVLYRGFSVLVPDVQRDVLAYFTNGDTNEECQYEMNVIKHSVQRCVGGLRELYTFDSFMNHSCSPTTISQNEINQSDGAEYDTVAVRDILPGEEITCDYDLFEWDCEDKGIMNCLCGAPDCRKNVRGFRHLPLEKQIGLLPIASEIVRIPWANEHPEIPLPPAESFP